MTHSNERTSGTPEGAPAGRLANDAPWAALRSDAATHLAAAQAEAFLAALGKDPATTRLRTFLGKGAKSGWDLNKAAKWSQNGGGVYFVTGNGGDSDAEITSCPALFVEWDDGASIEVQRNRWQELQLPEPTLMIWTGGKSLHCYWVLDQPMAPADWRPLQKRLIDYAGGDKACCNPSRLMRLPGFKYEKTPGAGDLCRILENPSGNRYKASDIAAALPVEVPPKPAARALEVLPGGLSGDLPPRGIDAINAAAGFIPLRVAGGKTYPSDRNALCGCSAALAEAGHPDADGAALALLGHLWPDESAAAQVLTTTTTRKASSFWAIAKEHGYDTRRHDLKSKQNAKIVNAADPTGGKRWRLAPDEVLAKLPAAVGLLRLNSRTGDIETDGEILSGNKIGRLYLTLSSQQQSWPKETTIDAAMLLASENQFDPVAKYLNNNKAKALHQDVWQRLDQHLLGINDPIAAAFLPRYFISAVARTFEPGCDCRQLPVLIGPQWRGKSALGRILFGAAQWVEGIGDLGKDALMKAHTAWGVELAELDGVTRRSDQESLKAFISETADTYRKPYDRSPERHPRRFVFWGSSNGAPLRDLTGNTRYVCIKIPDRMLPLEWATANRDALWAKAVEQYRAGEQWRDCSEAERRAIAERNADHREIDPWADDIAAYLERRQKAQDLPVGIPQVLEHLQVSKERQTNQLAARARGIAEAIGWEWGQRRDQAKKQRKGLWPCGAPGAPGGAPGGAPEQPSGSKASKRMVPPVPPKPKELETKAVEQAQAQRTRPLRTRSSASVPVSGAPVAPPHQTDCAATGLAGAPGGAPGGTGGTTPGTVNPTLRELIARAQADGELSEVDLIVKVQCLAIAAGLEQPVGAAITMAAAAMARSNG